VFHGKQGELRQRYREGQEDQLGALGLVVNMIVLWNTLYAGAALPAHWDSTNIEIAISWRGNLSFGILLGGPTL
jgi:TnpA family transposase